MGILFLLVWIAVIVIVATISASSQRPGYVACGFLLFFVGINGLLVAINKVMLMKECAGLTNVPRPDAQITAVNMNARLPESFEHDSRFRFATVALNVDDLARHFPFITRYGDYGSVTTDEGKVQCPQYAGYKGSDPVCLLELVPISQVANVTKHVRQWEGPITSFHHTQVLMWRYYDGEIEILADWNRISVSRNTPWVLYVPFFDSSLGSCEQPSMPIEQWIESKGREQ